HPFPTRRSSDLLSFIPRFRGPERNPSAWDACALSHARAESRVGDRPTAPRQTSQEESTVKIRTDEITSVIKQEIEQFAAELEISEVGRVVEVGDGIARIYGLSKAMAGEMIEFQTDQGGVMGQVMNLEEDTVGAVIYGDYLAVKEGDLVKSTGRLLEVPVGEEMLGRVVDPLGRPLDDGPAISTAQMRKIDIIAPGIAERQPVKEPLQTGIKAIDAMIPIGRGQRELIIGDR